MAATRLTDVIVPDVWNPYVVQRTAELSALWQSGIVAPVSDLDKFIADGGNTVNLPFWNDLSGNSQIVSATGSALTVAAIDSGQDKAVVCARGGAWGTNELAAQLSGDDPAGVIADLVAEWWARDYQDTLIAILTGIFESLGDESTAVNILDISEESGSAGIIDSDQLMDAQQLLGDSKNKLTAISMHSAVENLLAKQDVIDFIQPSDGSPRVPMYQDKRVIVDDSHPANTVSGVTGTVYDTYLFGPGAIGFANGTSKLTETEIDRVALQGEDILINRQNFILHPRGIAWDGTAIGGGPTNAEFETGTNWDRVWDAKNIRIVLLRHRIA